MDPLAYNDDTVLESAMAKTELVAVLVVDDDCSKSPIKRSASTPQQTFSESSPSRIFTSFFSHFTYKCTIQSYQIDSLINDAGESVDWTAFMEISAGTVTVTDFSHPDAATGPFTLRISADHSGSSAFTTIIEAITPPAEDPPAEDPPAEDPPTEDPPAEESEETTFVPNFPPRLFDTASVTSESILLETGASSYEYSLPQIIDESLETVEVVLSSSYDSVSY